MNNTTTRKRISILFAVIFACSVFFSNTIPTFAEDRLGTKENPHPVSTMEELASISSSLSDDDGDYYVILNADLEGSGFSLSDGNLTILGNGHSITMTSASSIMTSGDAILNLGYDGYGESLTVKSNGSTQNSIIALIGSSTLNMYDNVTVGPGSSSNNAAGIQMNGSSHFNMHGGTITDAVATGGGNAPGGVYVDDSSTFTMSGGTITNCTANNALAGAIALGWNGSFTMTGGTITSNSGLYAGGIVAFDNTTVNINGGEISNNSGTYAGGITSVSSQEMTINGNSIISGNSGQYAGAIMLMQGGCARVEAATITGNSTARYGGGIFCYDASTSVILTDDAKVYDNTANSYGDDVFANRGSVTLGAAPVGSTLDQTDNGAAVTDWYYDDSPRYDSTDEETWYIIDFTTISGKQVGIKAAHGNYTVTYQLLDDIPEGATTPEDTELSAGTPYTAEEAPEIEGYTFDGWYLDEAMTEKFEDGSAINDNTVLYGKYTEIIPDPEPDPEPTPDPEPVTPDEPQNPQESNTTAEKTTSTTAKTSNNSSGAPFTYDVSNISLFITLMIAAGAALAVITIRKKNF